MSPPQAAIAAPASHPLRGLLLFLLALLLFACLDSTTKYLAASYNVLLVVGVRYWVHLLLMLVALAPRQGRRLLQTQRPALVLARAGCLAAVSLFVALALQRMPVAETTAISFLAPMLVVLLAGPLLGERIGRVGWVAALAGFAGVLLIARPGSGLDAAGLGYALCAVVANAGYQLLSRVLMTTERALTLLFHTALVGSIVYGVLLSWSWHGLAPTPLQLLLFLSMGLTGGIGHFLFTLAYRDAPASMLAPMIYLQMLWAALLGWLVFGHLPDGWSIAGMGVVAASGALVAVAARRRSRRGERA